MLPPQRLLQTKPMSRARAAARSEPQAAELENLL